MAEVQTLRKSNIYERRPVLARVEYQHIKIAAAPPSALRCVTSAPAPPWAHLQQRRVKCAPRKPRVEYLYHDGDFYHFMDTETFERIALGPDVLEGIVDYLVDNQVVVLETYEGEPLSVSLPTTVDLQVVWAEAAIAGDTANADQTGRLQTGLRMQVPMFVNEGDTIRVDRDGSYVTACSTSRRRGVVPLRRRVSGCRRAPGCLRRKPAHLLGRKLAI